MSTVLGIDLGSTTTKIVAVADRVVKHSDIFPTGHDPLSRLEQVIRSFPHDRMVATGYGRHLLTQRFGAERITEIKACAQGVFYKYPTTRTILDVGGQDCKVIHIDEKGRVVDFEMNDRCAAGTGKFLEVMAHTFDMDIDRFIDLALATAEHITINSMCTVFAESEVVSLITSGKPRGQIARGLHVAIVNRLHSMLNRGTPKKDIIFVGGGARNKCLHTLLEERNRCSIMLPSEPQMLTALGAAMLAANNQELL